MSSTISNTDLAYLQSKMKMHAEAIGSKTENKAIAFSGRKVIDAIRKSAITITDAETPTEGSYKTYVVKQGGVAIGNIELPKAICNVFDVLVDGKSVVTDKVAYVDLSGKVDKKQGKSLFSGSYKDLTDKPTIPTITDTYDATSSNGMSGKAVATAVSGALDSVSIDSNGHLIIS